MNAAHLGLVAAAMLATASAAAQPAGDWASLARYRDANATLGAPKSGERRVVLFGDSITDGTCTTLDAHDRWEDLVSQRLALQNPIRFAVVNEGIGGNTVTNATNYQPVVNSAPGIERLERDVLSHPGVSHVVLFMGTNDLRRGASADLVISGMKDIVAPMYDQGYSALIEDLAQRGLLGNTMVCNLAEFGRTPRISKGGTGVNGRDHWPNCYSAMLAGAGVRGGAVYGASDKTAAYVKDDPVSLEDFTATLYTALGIDPATRLNLEMACTPAMIAFALALKPESVCVVTFDDGFKDVAQEDDWVAVRRKPAGSVSLITLGIERA